MTGLGGGGGRSGLCKVNVDKSTTRQETSSAAIRNGRSPTFSCHAANGRPPSSSSSEVVAALVPGMFPTIIVMGHLPSKDA
jgi:hypothetical protein